MKVYELKHLKTEEVLIQTALLKKIVKMKKGIKFRIKRLG